MLLLSIYVYKNVLRESKEPVNKKRKDILLLVICSEIPHIKTLHYVTTSPLNCDKTQETTEQEISEQTPVIKIKVSKGELT